MLQIPYKLAKTWNSMISNRFTKKNIVSSRVISPPKENPKIPVPSQNFSTPAKKKFRFPPQNTNFLEIHLDAFVKSGGGV